VGKQGVDKGPGILIVNNYDDQLHGPEYKLTVAAGEAG
jgi:hypothetical protein